jgi:DNA-binding CsgD family transcriptional regulator
MHHNEEYLKEQIAAGKSSVDISKELNVSWKLVEIYLRKYKIGHISKTKSDNG